MAREDTGPVREQVVHSPAGVDLAVRQTGDPEAQAVIVMHGLYGMRDYVLMGSTLLEEAGFRVIAYDARGHGRSGGPDDPEAYGYDLLAEDLVAVMDAFDVGAGILLGVSMGAHTSLRLALDQPERVAGLVVVTPAYDPEEHPHPDRMRRAIKLAEGIRRGGIEGFKESLEPAPGWGPREPTLRKLLGQRMRRHRDPLKVADALPAVMGGAPFGPMADIEAVSAPSVVVGTRDDYDIDHPYDLAERYAAALPGARLECEPEGKMPLAWNGRALATQALEIAALAGTGVPR